ncbi:MAG TPA: acetate kinase [Acidobacteriota bacterium]|nr:acetate kinase [Acidobacteriota bacterium]
MNVLVINCGSSSLRFQLIDPRSRRLLQKGIVERIGAVSSVATVGMEDKPVRHGVQAADHREALQWVLENIQRNAADSVEIQAVGHRVVHGGERFHDSVLIDEEVIDAIREAFDLAPLHNPANLEGILAAVRLLPEIPHVAVFDTAFHMTIPRTAYLYALPPRLYRRYRVRRYGFHGTSHYFVSRRLFDISELSRENSRVITCHLGNGASMAAVLNGRSIDTSMGLTPLPGLVMGTRCGDVDPSIIFYLIEKEEMSLNEVHSLLNRYSGLLGLSGFAADMRLLLEEAEKGDRRCQEAIEVFCYQARGFLGRYFAVLNGCDAIVFTAGIGENSPEIRRRVCSGLENLGVRLDPERNQEAAGKEMKISADDSRVQVWAIPTNEELVIAIDAQKIAETAKQTPWV